MSPATNKLLNHEEDYLSPATEQIPLADRISLKEKIGYSLGDASSNLYWKTFVF